MNAVTDALGAIAALGDGLWAPTQDTRLLRLHTPLGADLLVPERVQLDEGIGPDAGLPGGLRVQMTALSPDAHIDLKRLIGQPVLLELTLADGSRRPWHAHVDEFGLMGSDGGLARYRLVLQPWLALLAHRQDSWVFQGLSVPEIVDEVFADHAGQGALAPAWRWALEDPAVYPKRSLCIQYQESDLAFVQRLLREEGIVTWFEHAADPSSPSLGSHTLVLADHNGAFAPNLQPRVRFTQSGLGLAEDSLTAWQPRAGTHTRALALASADYRSCGQRPVQQQAERPGDLGGEIEDVPGQYAYPDSTQGERLALRRLQAIEADAQRTQASGPWRQATCGTHFTLSDHPRHTGLDDQHDRFVVLRTTHRMRNNLRADVLAGIEPGSTFPLGPGPTSPFGPNITSASRPSHTSPFGLSHTSPFGLSLSKPSALPNTTEEPLHHCHLHVQPLARPVRPPLAEPGRDEREHLPATTFLLKPRPTIRGTQTAVVVGAGAPVHTDRDHRIKVQFHWQRGASGSGRQPHPSGASNAPASDASGTWVRVAQSVAGANWGANFVPRVGQEVLVHFLGGDIDRPVVVGSVYNGRGQPDAQGNQVAAGGAGSTGNAPAWFPGSQAGHDHPAALSGHKSQELAASASGTGGHNQLVLDDSPGRARVELSSSMAHSRLQLGHLRQQQDNELLDARGHGVDLATTGHGALRAGAGILLSTHVRGSQPLQMDAREPQQQLHTGRELLHTLADSAVQHQATVEGQPAELPSETALKATDDSLGATQALGGTEGSAEAIGGGLGTVPAWGRPDMVLASPAGIAAHTPTDFTASAGATASLVAGQDIQHIAQAHHALVAKDGLVLYTYGQAQDPNKTNQETGLKLHAASGNVNLQAQTGQASFAADQAVDVASTQAMVKVTAPTHVLLTAAGAAIEIKGDAITLKAPGNVRFKASMKEWAGAGSASARVGLPVPQELNIGPAGSISLRFAALGADDLGSEAGWVGQPYALYAFDGEMLEQGVIGADGRIPRIELPASQNVVLELGDPARTEFTPIAFEAQSDQQSADEEDDDEDDGWDDPDVVAAAASLYKGTSAGHNSELSEGAFIGEGAVAAVLAQQGMTVVTSQE